MRLHRLSLLLPCLLLPCGLFSGCGGSSASGPSTVTSANGNMSGAGTTTTGSTGTGSGPPFTQTGTPLAKVSLPVGTWGGGENVDGPNHPATLVVRSDGSNLTLYCGTAAQYAGPITLDAHGEFTVTGTGHIRLNSLQPQESGKVLFSGSVATTTLDGKSETTLVLNISDPITGDGGGSYVLFLGKNALPYEGACPQ